MFLNTFFGILGLKHEEEEVWPDGTKPILFTEPSCVCMPNCRPVAPFFFPGKSTLFGFCDKERGVDILKCSPCDTDSNFMWVCGLTSSVN